MRATQDQIERAERIHSESIVIAGHTDICPDVAKRQRSGQVGPFAARHAPVLRRGGVTAVCDHVAGDAAYLIDFPFRNFLAANRLKFGMQGIEAMLREARDTPDDVVIATSTDDIAEAKARGKVAIVLCFEGASPIEDDPSLLELFHRLGIRVIGLTHDNRNLLADGVRVGSSGGLTALGREAVAEMNRLGIVIDVSHLNQQGFWDVVEASAAPVHASHSNCAALCDVPRNLSDDQLRAIAQSGGVVGAHALRSLVTSRDGKPTFEEFMGHIEHMVEVMGEDFVSIGPDMMENYPEAEYELLWQTPRHPPLNFEYPAEFDSYAKFPNITLGLVQRGFSDDAIRKILGGNLLRMLREVWGTGASQT